MAIDVTLDEQELDLTAYVGEYRHMVAKAKGYHRPINITGPEDEAKWAAAEYVVAKTLGVFWNALSESFRGMPDLADGSEVKHASNPRHNLLIPANAKRRMAWYYLVLGDPPTMTIWGKAWGDNVMDDKHWFTGMREPGWRIMKNDLAMVLFDG